MKKTKFSIIIPVYNVENYLKKCLNNILNQTYNNFEIILINDGSTDRSGLICDEYEKKDPRIIVLHQQNKGLSDARNKGISQNSGDYIIFVDSDDYIELNYLEMLKNIIVKSNHPDIIRISGTVILENSSQKINSPDFLDQKPDKIIDLILDCNYIEPSWLYVYKTSFWKKNEFKFPLGKFHEDFALTPVILAKANSISSTSYPLYNYLKRENSIMTSSDYEKTKRKVYDFLEHYDFHEKILKSKKSSLCKKLLSFSAENTIYKGTELNNEDMLLYIDELKKRKIEKNIYPKNIKKILKKVLLRYNMFGYMKRVKEKRND